MVKSVICSLVFVYCSLVSFNGSAQSKAARQKEADDKILTEYFTANNIQATKTKSGLYYVISRKGVGPNAWRGQTVTVNYTGRTMDGHVFDSSTNPITFSVGMGRVIKGWDEGLQLMNKGSKGVLYIPSGLAYSDRSPAPTVPPHSIMIFDVELLDIEK